MPPILNNLRLIPNSFNGFAFQQGTRVASTWNTPYDWTIAGVTTNAIPRSQNFPQYVSKNYAGGIKIISIVLNDVDADRDSLVISMDVLGDEQHQLFALDKFGNLWYVNAICIGLNEEGTEAKTASFGLVFDVDDPVWKKYIPSTQDITLLYGAGSASVTPLGNQPALPVIKITPIDGGGTGFAYKAFFKIINTCDKEMRYKPFDLTDGGMDTASLVSGGVLLSTGDDLRIFIDGVEVKRWFGGGGINSATTTIWINLSQIANTNTIVGNNIANSGAVTTVQLLYSGSVRPSIPSSGLFTINDEIFVYTGTAVTLPGMIILTGCTRAERGTSMEAHTAGDAVYFIHDIWMYYDYAGITPYVVDDTQKPLIDLVNSTNTNFIWSATFSDISGNRTGAWKSFQNSPYTPSPFHGIYTATERTFADPASVMGGYVVWAPVPWYVMWSYYDPCGILSIASVTGQKYANWGPPYAWWTDIFMEKSLDGMIYDNVWTEDTPSVKQTWEALDTHTAVDLSGSYQYLRVKVFAPTVFSTNSPDCGHEIDYVSVELDPTRVPTVEMLAVVGNDVNLNSTLTNAANGLSMTIALSMQFGQYLIVDTKEKTITMYDGTNQIPALVDMPIRAEWFPFEPGVQNDITIADAGTVLYEIEWEDRAL